MKNKTFKTLQTNLIFLAFCCFGSGVILTALDGKLEATMLFIAALMFSIFIYYRFKHFDDKI